MKTKIVFNFFALLIFSVGAFSPTLPAPYSEQLVQTSGKNSLDCTIIRPWAESPSDYQYPIIVWANGWDYQNKDTTSGYKPGLIEWALDGPYVVIAANSRSPRETDVLKCLQWLVDQNTDSGSEYYGVLNTAKIGLAGHSQGGGAAIKAGDGEPNGFDITAVAAMNPYGANWRGAGSQDGPVLAIGGSEDTVVPISSFEPAWIAIQNNDQGGILSVLQGGDHNTDAWAPDGVDPTTTNFGNFQTITNLWWRFHLNGDTNAGRSLKRILDKEPWVTDYAFTPSFQLP